MAATAPASRGGDERFERSRQIPGGTLPGDRRPALEGSSGPKTGCGHPGLRRRAHRRDDPPDRFASSGRGRPACEMGPASRGRPATRPGRDGPRPGKKRPRSGDFDDLGLRRERMIRMIWEGEWVLTVRATLLEYLALIHYGSPSYEGTPASHDRAAVGRPIVGAVDAGGRSPEEATYKPPASAVGS
jgi:hypothetical protein